MRSLLALCLFAFLPSLVFAQVPGDESVYLDPPYDFARRPKVEKQLSENLSSKVDLLDMAKAQSQVRAQGRRGTCSIFSATALLEFHLAKLGVTDTTVDLSEQWLEYLTAGQNGMEGSWSEFNFNAYGEYGYLPETAWPYNPVSWTPYSQEYWDNQASLEEKELFEKLCGPTRDTFVFDNCLIGQRNSELLFLLDEELLIETSTTYDPAFAQMRQDARKTTNALHIRGQWLNSNKEIQEALDSGEALTLDVDFFYEAWNHGKSESIGLARNLAAWDLGEVSYPHKDSRDYSVSRESANRAGHSVVIIGYDRSRLIEKTVLNKKGKPMKITTKGVYYFKNSWGTEGFGRDFKIDGTPYPGYGMISMDYAHEYGNFARLKIRKL